MASTKEFRQRIKSANNTKQITKAMEMISSIKMQKAVKNITMARSYIQNAWNILHMLSKTALHHEHPLLNPKVINKTAVILITSDRGLCGSYNNEVIKKLIEFNKDSSDCDIVAIGKVGAGFISSKKLGNLTSEFKGFENDFTIEDIIPISKMTFGEYLTGKYDKVVLIYSHYVSSIKQSPVVQQLLPIVAENISDAELWEKTEEAKDTDYKFEPDADEVLEGVLKQIVRTQIYGAILEANASEQSARMLAMKNATDSASDLIDDLTLLYNSLRQDTITREIAEISGAAEAMK